MGERINFLQTSDVYDIILTVLDMTATIYQVEKLLDSK